MIGEISLKQAMVIKDFSGQDPEKNIQRNIASSLDNNTGVKQSSQNQEKNQNQPLQNYKSEKEANQEGLLNLVKQEFNLINNVELKFDKDRDTGQTFIKIIDKESGDTIREIPPEEVRRLAKKLDEMIGLLFDKKV